MYQALFHLACSLFFVYFILRPNFHELPTALSKGAWIIVVMPDGTVQLTTRNKQWTERVVLATLCIFGQVILIDVKLNAR